MSGEKDVVSDAAETEAAFVTSLATRVATLEKALEEVQTQARERVKFAELKAAALQAGILDLDGLKLFDLSTIDVDESGHIIGAEALFARAKREKPWLFRALSSSSRASAPPAQPPRMKLATEMTEEEYRAARAELLRKR